MNMVTAVVAVSLTFLIALIGSVWKIATLLAHLGDSVRNLAQDVQKLELSSTVLQQVPMLNLRIDRLEQITTKLDDVTLRVRSLEAKLSGQFRAVKP